MLWYQMYFLHKEDYSNLRLISVIDLIFLAVLSNALQIPARFAFILFFDGVTLFSSI